MEDWNLDNPSTLLSAGTRKGKALNLKTNFESLIGSAGRILVGRLKPNTTIQLNDGEDDLVAIKVVIDSNPRVPRDLRREATLLSTLNHPNILSLLNAYHIPSPSLSSSTFYFFTPLYPLTLSNLLESPNFTSELESFDLLAHSLAWQMISSISYLHSQQIAHRDVGPGNFVIARNGRVVLIDFGISIKPGDEVTGRMHYEVGTGPYRAPELLFGARSYDIFALDLWALGATLAELFTPFELPLPPSPSSESSNTSGRWDERDFNKVMIASTPTKKTLFNGGGSDFALFGSIFKIRGIPTLETWPESANLPDFFRFSYIAEPPVSLESLLPHLPVSPSPLLSIIDRLLIISARSRLAAAQALEDPDWSKVVIFKPEGTELSRLVEQFII